MSKMLDPISSSSEVGEDYKYEDLYFVIQNEIDKLQNISGDGKTDWAIVNENSKVILETHSKDLKLLSYWLFAQWKLNKWTGLLTSLPIYIDVIKRFHNNLFPKKNTAKVKLLEWLKDKLLTELLIHLKNFPKNDRQPLEELLKELDEVILIEIKDTPPINFSLIIRKLDKALESQKSTKPAKKEFKKEEIVQKEKVVHKEKIKKEKSSSIEKYTAIPLLEDMKKYINEVYIIEMKKGVPNIIFLELLQNIAFIELENILNSQQEIDSHFFPEKDIRDRFKNSFKKVKTQELLEELYKELMLYPTWIEGYFLIVSTSEALPSKQKFKKIKYNLSYFIDSNHQLLNKYSPKNYNIISIELQEWMKTFSKNTIKYNQKYAEASTLAKKGRRKEAIIFLDELYHKSDTEEESFLWRLKQVSMAIEVRETQIAIALLYDLENKIDKHHLNMWNPTLAIEVYILFLKPTIARELTLEKRELIYHKLCTISTQSAVKLEIN